MMQFGVCYYPEHWPETRWAEDARQMRTLGLSIVRIAEFAWSRLEPQEGRFDWDWLERAVAVLDAAGLKIVLGTPTAAPPAWLSRGYPNTLPVDEQGRRRNFGSRRHYCPNSPEYRRFTRRMVTEMAARFAAHPSVIGWQIDNEFGGGGTARCYCEHCAAAFRNWLQRRYAALESLNQAWGTVFWSQEYSSWEQIGPPMLTGSSANPSHLLDYYRFASDSWVDYQQMQLAALQPHRRSDQFATHNAMGMFFTALDYFRLAAPLDFISLDNYPTAGPDRIRGELYGEESPPAHDAPDAGDPAITGFELDLARGWKDAPFWIMEQQPGHVNWGWYNPGVPPETVRLWTWQAVAAGAEAVVYFRWRSTLFAQEQYHAGLLKHDATPDVGYRALELLAGEREQLERLASGPVQAQAAILFDYNDLWALQLQPHRRGFSYLRLAFTWYRAFQRLGIPVDIRPYDADLNRYRLLVAPSLHLGDAGNAARLEAYVQNGGLLLVGLRSGFKTPSNLVTDQPLPGVFSRLCGVHVQAWQALPPGVSFRLEGVPALSNLEAGLWAESLAAQAEGVELPLRYASGPFEGQGALSMRPLGKGVCGYLGWHPTAEQAAELLAWLAGRAGVGRLAELPPGLVAQQRAGQTVLLNFTESLLSAVVKGELVEVEPRGVRLVD
jgi:beta-galactosidase